MQPLVYVGGWGWNGTEFMYLANNLPDSKTLILSISDLKSDSNSFAEKLVEIISRENNPVTLVGWSMGAMLAIEAIAINPSLVQKIILFSPTTKFTQGVEEAVLIAMKNKLVSHPRETLAKFYRKSFSPYIATEQMIEDCIKDSASFEIPLLIECLEYLITTNLENVVSKIKCPGLVFHGEEDKIIPWRAGVAVSQGIANSRLITMKGVGHCIFHQLSPENIESIKTFIYEY